MNRDKILIFEDTKRDHDKLADELSKNGLYEVMPYADLSTAIDAGTSFDYVKNIIKDNWNKNLKLIICDLIVKNENLGEKLIGKIRNEKDFCVEECKSFSCLIPIIIWTGNAEQNDIDAAISAGANDFAYKPSFDATDQRTIKDNPRKIELLKEKIKRQISFFDQRLEIAQDNIPIGIKDEVKKFKEKHAGKTTAFIMTSFAEEHKKVGEEIIKTLEDFNIKGFMADDTGGKNYDDLLPNIEVFMYGCDFGIGIYADNSILTNHEKIRINSNLSFEVGYMLSLQKKVCILKEKKLPKLNSDLCSKIYVEFEFKKNKDLKNKLKEWINIKITVI